LADIFGRRLDYTVSVSGALGDSGREAGVGAGPGDSGGGMADENKANTGDGQADGDPQASADARHQSTEADKAKARKWFARAKQLFETRNYEFAIKCYVDGLAFWPEAVEEAHKPLHVCALARRQAGGKKPGMRDSVKYSMTGKDAVKAMLNAEWLWAHDPASPSYSEGILKNANKAHCDDTLMWIGPIYREAIQSEKKPSAKRFGLLKAVYEECGDRARSRGELVLAAKAFESALEALAIQKQLTPKDLSLDGVVRDLSTKLTILKGQYETAESFTDSVRDADTQRAVHDKDRMFQTEERLGQLIQAAEADVEANPDVPAKVMSLVDLLCRRDDEAYEKRAISILLERFKAEDDYRFKMRADDIRMRQLTRRVRKARESGDKDSVRQAMIKQLQFEIPVFKERVSKYPTDLRLKYELGVRLFTGRRHDDAIPYFQQARGEPRVRTNCLLYLGRCFYEKGYYEEAITSLDEARATHEVADDQTAKELLYWLGRSQADAEQPQAALKTFGLLLQVDYNYKDVRGRIDDLRKG
jgi:tetratricopeptide (TPR) repeat protein